MIQEFYNSVKIFPDTVNKQQQHFTHGNIPQGVSAYFGENPMMIFGEMAIIQGNLNVF